MHVICIINKTILPGICRKQSIISQSTTGWYAGTLELTHADVVIAEFLEFVSRLDKNADKLFEGFPLMEAQYKKVYVIYVIFLLTLSIHFQIETKRSGGAELGGIFFKQEERDNITPFRIY